MLALAVAAVLGVWLWSRWNRDGRAQRARATTTARLGMTPPIACREIEGYEEYEPLPDAALTSDEKLLVYFRPRHYKSTKVGKKYARSPHPGRPDSPAGREGGPLGEAKDPRLHGQVRHAAAARSTCGTRSRSRA